MDATLEDRLDPVAAQLVREGEESDTPNSHLLPLAQARSNFENNFGAQNRFAQLTEIRELEIPLGRRRMAARLYCANDESSEGLIVFVHGGGFLMGSLESHDGLARDLCLAARRTVVSLEYRLAPEARFPTQPRECAEALRWIAAHRAELGVHAEAPIALAGDSAGGSLVVAMALLARDEAGPGICAVGAFYPVITTGVSGRNFDSAFEGVSLFADEIAYDMANYMPEEGLAQDRHLVELLEADLAGLPPLAIVSCECDPLHNQSDDLAAAIQAAGGSCALREYPGMIHGFVQLPKLFAAALPAIDWLAERLNEQISAPSAAPTGRD